jgi:hypothetical protein
MASAYFPRQQVLELQESARHATEAVDVQCGPSPPGRGSKRNSLRNLYTNVSGRSSLRNLLSLRSLGGDSLCSINGNISRNVCNNKQGAFGLTPFFKLAKQRKFDEIMCILKDQDPDVVAVWLDDTKAMQRGTPLHIVLAFHPPVPLVNMLCAVLTRGGVSPEDSVDSHGRTPLHIAAASTCDLAVLHRLLYGTAAMICDNLQRCPLHYACSFKKSKKEDDRKAAIYLLIEAYPMARSIIDATGQKPLDIARKSKADQSVLCALIEDSTLKPERRKFSDFHSQDNATSTAKTSEADTIPREIVRREVSSSNVSALFDLRGVSFRINSNEAREQAGKEMALAKDLSSEDLKECPEEEDEGDEESAKKAKEEKKARRKKRSDRRSESRFRGSLHVKTNDEDYKCVEI